MSRCAKALVVFTLTCSLGGHWVFLQSVAWVGMMVTYSQNAPFAEAVSMTFDGRHPCRICKVVEEGKSSEKQQDVQTSSTRLDLLLVARQPALPPPPPFPAPPAFADISRPRTESPPTPPPRAA